jgi:outer membrane protein assembly factor BamB
MQNQYGGFVYYDGYIYGGTKGSLTCLDFLTGKVMWKNGGVGIGSLTLADGHIYMRGDKGPVALIKATPEGYREISRFELERSGRPVRAYPVVTGGRLYLRDENLLFCYDVRAKTALGKTN